MFGRKIDTGLKVISRALYGLLELWAKAPPPLKLRVDKSNGHRRQHRTSGTIPPGVIYRTEAPRTLKHIRLERLNETTGSWYACSIAIDLERCRVDVHRSCPDLFGPAYLGSAGIGILIFSVPFAFVSAPLLFAVNTYHQAMERRHGMSRYGVAVMNALKGQLDAETEMLLTEALKNTWRHEQELQRKISFEDAQPFLNQHTLTEQRFPSGKLESADWHNLDQERVASAWGDEKDNVTVFVLGSTFEGEQAKKLLERFKERIIERYEPF